MASTKQPGGHYLNANGDPVNANGNRIEQAIGEVPEETGGFPEDFPHAGYLDGTDYDSPAAVADASDAQLEAVDGLSEKRIGEIRAHLAENEEA